MRGSFGSFSDESGVQNLCQLQFTIERDIPGPVFQYYRLENFYQNLRMYVKSVNAAQLAGRPLLATELDSCSPLVSPDEKATKESPVYYPCGLIANSYFSDTFGGMWQVSRATSSGGEGAAVSTDALFAFSGENIAWPHEKIKYGPSAYTLDAIRPPPSWASNRKLVNSDGKYKAIPNFVNDERFQNWMSVAALPTFRKVYGRLDTTLPSGVYRILIDSGKACLLLPFACDGTFAAQATLLTTAPP